MKTETVFIDGIESLGVHNNVARLQLIQLQPDGSSETELKLLIPVAIVQQIVDALNQVAS